MILFSLVALASETAATTAIPSAPVETTAAAPAPKVKKICRVEDGGDPSSRFQKRTCLTADQWKQRARASNDSSGSGNSAAGSSD